MASQLGHLNHLESQTLTTNVLQSRHVTSSEVLPSWTSKPDKRVTQSWTWLYIRFYWCRTRQCLFVNERKYTAGNKPIQSTKLWFLLQHPSWALQESSHIIRWPVEHDTFSIKPECYFVSNWIHWCFAFVRVPGGAVFIRSVLGLGYSLLRRCSASSRVVEFMAATLRPILVILEACPFNHVNLSYRIW